MQSMEENVAAAESMLKMLANRHRLLILCSLVQGEKTVTQLLEKTDLSQSALSQHLAKLREQQLVLTEKRGQSVFYTLGSMEVHAILSTLHLIYCRD